MNIHDIQISKITSQYLDYLHKLEELNVDVSADFIYMAATLIYIKSKMLLPPDPLGSPEEQAIDPRAELVQRLVEHEKFKNAAQLLYQKQQIEENVWSKPDKIALQRRRHRSRPRRLARRPRQSLSAGSGAPQRSLAHRAEARTIHRGADDGAASRADRGQRRQHRAPDRFFEACPSRHAMIVAFLAVLEMVKMQAVALAQEKQFGEIVVKKGKSFDAVFDENGGIRQAKVRRGSMTRDKEVAPCTQRQNAVRRTTRGQIHLRLQPLPCT